MGLNKSLLRLIVFILIFIALPLRSQAFFWMIYHKPVFKGKVIDAETKEPIEGAVVVVSYAEDPIVSGPGGGSEMVIHVKETLTNKEGVFTIPSYNTIINPNASEGMATFIIFKPGYGNFPDYQIVPNGITPVGQETYFSKEVGREGEMELWAREEKGPALRKRKVTFGIVELPRLKTRDERNKAHLLSPTDEEREWPILHKMIEEEDEWLKNNRSWRR